MESSAAFCPFTLVLILHDCFIKCPWRGGHMCQVLDTSQGPKITGLLFLFGLVLGFRLSLRLPKPGPKTHRSSLGSSHESGGNETQSAVARGVISGREKTPSSAASTPYISNVSQPLGLDFNLANRVSKRPRPWLWPWDLPFLPPLAPGHRCLGPTTTMESSIYRQKPDLNGGRHKVF